MTVMTEASSNMDPFGLVGTKVAGKYDIEEVVALTTLSVVYRATHRVWRRSVAIKAFTAPMLAGEARQQLLASFVEEGRLLMDLSERCASICQARDVASLTTPRGEWVPYTVLEWLDGECLEMMLHRERAEGARPRTLAEAIDLLNPVAAALSVAHDRGVTHRDVKPGNIFVLRIDEATGECPSEGSSLSTCRVKLLDFGVAERRSGGVRASSQSSFTPAYGSPEQFFCECGTTGPWTDVFALALIVVELMVGRPALAGEDVGDLALSSSDPVVRPTARALGVPTSDEVDAVLARALALKSEDRFASARAFWDALVLTVARDSGHDLEVTWDAGEEGAAPALLR
ncbi:MAG: serine/threonine-protein kinase [Polyangiaceae bacterium]